MRNVLKSSLRWIGKQEAGFSLMEIIVAIGIMAAIAAITVPLVTRFTSTGESGAKTSEKESMETALESYMAEAGLTSVTAQAYTNSFASGVLAGFLKKSTTTYCYKWTTAGVVTGSEEKATVTACASAVDD